ncbi:MAG: hypothetical protein HRF42_13305 [Candidatus Brocadia sp.]|jgi:type II secretory pathway pseudopilin PulG
MFKKQITVQDNGFTILEIILSVTIIAIGLFAVIGTVTAVIKGNKHSKRITTATAMAQDKIEYFKRMDYNSIIGTSTVSPDYYLVASVENDTPLSNTKTVTISVYWNPATTTSSYKAEVKTIIAKE